MDFDLASFSASMTSYFLPWLALTAQLPFETGDLWSSTMSFCLAVGSPAFVTYSLVTTILNRYWIRKQFSELQSKAHSLSIRQKYRGYEDRMRAAQYLLQEAQQVPLRASQEKGWLSSLIVIPRNDEWWEHLESRLKSTRRGVTASLVAQMALASVTYLFAIITSLVGSLGDQAAGLQIASGSLWIWLIPVILGWITVGTQSSHRTIDVALRSELASRALEPPIPTNQYSERHDQQGLIVRSGLSPQQSRVQTVIGAMDTPDPSHLEVPNWCGADVEGDDKRKGPIYNYARLFTWWQLASTMDHAFWKTLDNVSKGTTCDTGPGLNTWRWNDLDPTSNLEGDIKGTADYCGLHMDAIHAYPEWSAMPSYLYRRIFSASLWALFLQWGTTGASIMIAYSTMTVGLGCRLGSYLIYGVAGTLVWLFLLTSQLLSHEVMLRYQKEHILNPSIDFRLGHDPKQPVSNSYERDWAHSALCAAAVILRYFGKAIAIANTLWLIIQPLLELIGAYDNCWCRGNAGRLGREGWVVLFKDAQDLKLFTSPPWDVQLCITTGVSLGLCACAIAFFAFRSRESNIPSGQQQTGITVTRRAMRNPVDRTRQTHDVRLAKDISDSSKTLIAIEQAPQTKTAADLGFMRLVQDAVAAFRTVISRSSEFIGEVQLQKLVSQALRPRIPEGKIRITWPCHCATELYADFPDTNPAAIARLSEQLNQLDPVADPLEETLGGNSSSSQAPSPAQPADAHLAGPPPRGLASYQRTVWQANASLGQPANIINNTQQTVAPAPTLLPRYLELCVNTGSLCQTLSEIDVTRIASDIELFHWIRKRYKDLRGWRTQARFCLRPKSMKFVYFGLEKKQKVHILCDRESLPPEAEVIAERYHYAPCPPQPPEASPMPSNVFIHFLHYCKLEPDTGRAQKIWLDRLPKKVKESLAQQHQSQGLSTLVEAWGVHVIEGVDNVRMLWTVVLTLTVSLAPLLIAYIAITGKVQDATGIASLVVAVIAALWMCMQIEIGRNT
ncbi:hypothetical protein LTR85_003445 [Meristemomyces frigidus]|nr:hypothetical protein LTR85_003445 [Meristemomyces frigidus]